MVKVKICGITNIEDAELAFSLGASALGMIFDPQSPRFVQEKTATIIRNHFNDRDIEVWGVFVNATPEYISKMVSECHLSCVQLHGDEEVSTYAQVGVPLVKAIHAQTQEDVEAALKLRNIRYVLIDSRTADKRGGTGQVANWNLALQISLKRPIVLAGGINSANVNEAIKKVKPQWIDVATGVEAEPGKKSPEKLKAFFEAIKKEMKNG